LVSARAVPAEFQGKISMCETVRPVFDKPLKISFLGPKIDQNGELEDTFPW